MGDSTDSEEFYDAEEFTPIKGSKSISLTESTHSIEKDKTTVTKNGDAVQPASIPTVATEVTPAQDDRNNVKNVVQGRRKFAELRRCMQAEDEDEPETALGDPHGYALEQPFKIISHDTMSLQSMTSLGRIGRILSGAAESHPNIRETPPAPPAAREPPAPPAHPADRTHTVLAEPDVIASTKANSLKQSRAAPAAIVAVAGLVPPAAPAGPPAPAAPPTPPAPPATPATPAAPVAPPRKKKRNKLHGSQSLSTTDGDNVSVCTTDTDELRYTAPSAAPAALAALAAPAARRLDKPQLDTLLVEPPLSSVLSQSAALPSPASTIESLTREFQDSLELSQARYAELSSLSVHESRASERAHSAHSAHSTLDIKEAVKGEYVVRPQDEERSRGAGGGGARTHSEGRAATGTSSLGSTTRRAEAGGGESRARRRSAGDWPAGAAGAGGAGGAGGLQQLSDLEILEQVTVLNLDTGERVPLSVAEHKLPQCINPLSLQIMRLTSEYVGRAHHHGDASAERPLKQWRKRLSFSSCSLLRPLQPLQPLHSASSTLSISTRETDEESESVCAGGADDEGGEEVRGEADQRPTALRRNTDKLARADLVKCHSQDHINVRLKRFFGSTVRRTVEAARSLAAEVSHARHKEDVADIADDVRGDHTMKLKASNSHKGPYDFDGCVRHVQELGGAGGAGGGHSGAVWCCKFSGCGRLLATAGQDRLLRVWVTRDAHHMFQELRTKYNAEQKSSPSPSQESLSSLSAPPPSPEAAPLRAAAPFCPRPFCVYAGHTSDLLDLSWSKNYFILSSSMDKTVRLWHISRGECLCCFQHIDFVTAIVFHPRDDRYFLSGSLDGKLRLWNIPDKKVAVWNEVDGKTKLITAANFCQNGKFAVVGTYDGRCIFYTTDQLKYHTQIDVRSTRGKNSTGRKISGIEPMPGDDRVLVTSNDSRIRLYDLRDLNLSCKYRGYVNVSSQIKASFSHDGRYIVSGSENQCIYIWKTCHDYSKFTSVRRDRNDFWEGIKAHNAVVTCAVFAPNPDQLIRTIGERERREAAPPSPDVTPAAPPPGDVTPAAPPPGDVSSAHTGHVLVSADFNGCIKVFVHRAKPKHSSLPASALA